MSIESEGVTSNVELESVLACEGDLRLHEMVNLEGEPTSPKAPAEQERETRLEAIVAGRAELHDVTVLGEEPDEESPEARIILDHEQVHRTGLTRVSERTLKKHVIGPTQGTSNREFD